MAHSTPEEVAHDLLLHCELAGIERARLWVRNSFRDLIKQRPWSWLVKRGQFILPAVYSTGTITTTQGQDTVAGVGTVWTSAMIGRQLRSGTSQLYTIIDVTSATALQLDRPWGETALAAATYEIYQAYVTVPEDFDYFLSVINPAQGYQLSFGQEQREIDQDDPARTAKGSPYVLASADFTTVGAGNVRQPVQVAGSGNDPTASGTYTGLDDALFTVEVTTTGVVGTAQFKWKKDSGAYTTGVVTDEIGNFLSNGVTVAWPAGVSYTSGDVFVIHAEAATSAGLARYEVYPHVVTTLVLPYFYVSTYGDLFDEGVLLPRTVTGEVLLEYALAKLARWPGPSEEQRNPYFQIALAESHERNAARMIRQLEQKDDNIYPQDVSYYQQLPYGGWRGADWHQKHA